MANKLLTFEEFCKLYEAPQRMKGDAPFPEDNDYLSAISKRGIDNQYELLLEDKVKNLYLYRSNNLYVVGNWGSTNEKDKFYVYTELDLDLYPKFKSKQKQFNKDVYVVNTIHTHTKWKYKGISTFLYSYIINSGFIIISDKIQYEGAVNLWKKFPSIKDAVVYIYDIDEDKIISKYTENTPESHIWSDDVSKRKIRLVFMKLQ